MEQSLTSDTAIVITGSVRKPIRTIRTPESTWSEVHEKGEHARTDYQVLAYFEDPRPPRQQHVHRDYRGAGGAGGAPARDDEGSFSLVACDIPTGRTHQIRVHMASLGHPLVGDDKYAPPNSGEGLGEGGGRARISRLFLHSFFLSFLGPGGVPQRVVAPLPAELRSVLLSRLKISSVAGQDSEKMLSDSIFGNFSFQNEILEPVAHYQVQCRLLSLVEEAQRRKEELTLAQANWELRAFVNSDVGLYERGNYSPADHSHVRLYKREAPTLSTLRLWLRGVRSRRLLVACRGGVSWEGGLGHVHTIRV